MTERMDGDRIIVTGYSGGSHFPREQRYLNYTWEANGLSPEGPFQVAGSVYGRGLRLRGPGTIGGSILGRGDVALEHHGPGVQRLMCGLSASGNVSCRVDSGALAETVIGDIRKVDYAIRGDVLAENVLLDNAIVFGNIEATNIRLRNSIVFGALIARETLTITASTALYYHARDVVFEGPCCMLNAMGESASAPVFAPHEDGAGQLYQSDVRFYPVFRGAGSGALTNRPWEAATPAGEQSRLYAECDWVNVRAFEAGGSAKGSESARHVLSIAGRALNFGVIEHNLKALYNMLRSGLEYEHYTPEAQLEAARMWKQTCTANERFVLLLVNSRPDEK